MPDWTRSMQQTYEFYEVNPVTWADAAIIRSIVSCTITRDLTEETLGSASIECTEDLTDKYVRVYLVTVQDGVRERIALGTFLCQTPSTTFDGRYRKTTQDGYTPLIELKEKTMPIGYAIAKNQKILSVAKTIVTEGGRAPVSYDTSVNSSEDAPKLDANFVSDISDTRFTFTKDLLANAGYHFEMEPDGTILFMPDQSISSMQPFWEYTDDNSSILLPSIELSRDLYGVPNVVEVIYSPSDTAIPYSARVANSSKNSIVSTVNRGREIVYRETSPDVAAGLTEAQVKEYAKDLLKRLSSIEYTLSYSHGYCDVRVGDCVRLNYERAGITNVKAMVTRQVISCVPGCTVQETAVYTEQLWG